MPLDVEQLKAVLDQGDASQRLEILKLALRNMDNPDIFRVLNLHAAREQDLKVLSNLLKVLAVVGKNEAMSTIIKFLSHDDDRIRANAVEALEMTGSENTPLYLFAVLNDPCSRVRINCIKALNRHEAIDPLPLLDKLLSSETAAQRAGAAWIVAHLNDPQAMQRLLTVYKSETDPDVRARMAVSLGTKPDASVLQAFAEALPGAAEAEKAALIQALGKSYLYAHHMQREVVDTIFATLHGLGTVLFGDAVANAFDDTRTMESLQDDLRSFNPHIRRGALIQFTQLFPNEVPNVLESFVTDPDPEVAQTAHNLLTGAIVPAAPAPVEVVPTAPPAAAEAPVSEPQPVPAQPAPSVEAQIPAAVEAPAAAPPVTAGDIEGWISDIQGDDQERKVSALKYLAVSSDPRAGGMIEMAMFDPDPEVQRIGKEALLVVKGKRPAELVWPDEFAAGVKPGMPAPAVVPEPPEPPPAPPEAALAPSEAALAPPEAALAPSEAEGIPPEAALAPSEAPTPQEEEKKPETNLLDSGVSLDSAHLSGGSDVDLTAMQEDVDKSTEDMDFLERVAGTDNDVFNIKNLTTEQKSILTKNMTSREFPVGKFIFRDGEEVKFWFMIKSGSVELLDPEGNSLAILGSGDSISEMPEPGQVIVHTTKAKALEDVVVLVMDTEKLNTVSTALPEVHGRMRDISSERRAALARKIFNQAQRAKKEAEAEETAQAKAEAEAQAAAARAAAMEEAAAGPSDISDFPCFGEYSPDDETCLECEVRIQCSEATDEPAEIAEQDLEQFACIGKFDPGDESCKMCVAKVVCKSKATDITSEEYPCFGEFDEADEGCLECLVMVQCKEKKG